MSGASTSRTGALLDLPLKYLPVGRRLIAPGGRLARASVVWQRSTPFSGGSGLGWACASTGLETRR